MDTHTAREASEQKEVSLTVRFEQTPTTSASELKERLVAATLPLVARGVVTSLSIEEVFPGDDQLSSFRGIFAVKFIPLGDIKQMVTALREVTKVDSVYPSPAYSAF